MKFVLNVLSTNVMFVFKFLLGLSVRLINQVQFFWKGEISSKYRHPIYWEVCQPKKVRGS